MNERSDIFRESKMDNMQQDLEDIEDKLYTQEFNLQVTDASNQEDTTSVLTLTNTEHASIEKKIHQRQQSLNLMHRSFEDIDEEPSHLEQSHQATDLASSFNRQMIIHNGTLEALNMYTKSLRNSLTEDFLQGQINLIPIPEGPNSPPVRRQLTYPEIEVIESESCELPQQIHQNYESPEMPNQYQQLKIENQKLSQRVEQLS